MTNASERLLGLVSEVRWRPQDVGVREHAMLIPAEGVEGFCELVGTREDLYRPLPSRAVGRVCVRPRVGGRAPGPHGVGSPKASAEEESLMGLWRFDSQLLGREHPE